MSDLISRQAAIDVMWKALYAYEDLTEKQFMEHEELELEDWFQHRIFVQRMHEECMKAVESLPSAEPKIGEWIEVEKNEYEGFSIVNMRCNQCRKYAYLVLPKGTKCVYDFCPNCGARMVREDGE